MPEMNKQRIIGMVLIFLLLAIIDKGCNRPTGVGSGALKVTRAPNRSHTLCHISHIEAALE